MVCGFSEKGDGKVFPHLCSSVLISQASRQNVMLQAIPYVKSGQSQRRRNHGNIKMTTN